MLVIAVKVLTKHLDEQPKDETDEVRKRIEGGAFGL